MFLNCGEFVEINSDLFATYLFNDLSKTFTNVLQITKFYKKKAADTPPLLKVALKMKTFSFNTMMKFTQEEPLQHFFRV